MQVTMTPKLKILYTNNWCHHLKAKITSLTERRPMGIRNSLCTEGNASQQLYTRKAMQALESEGDK